MMFAIFRFVFISVPVLRLTEYDRWFYCKGLFERNSSNVLK
jgi:hypothetical protein